MRRNLPFSVLRKHAWHAAAKLAAYAPQCQAPVALHEFAARLRIRRLEFRPMLSTAGIAVVPDGYVIFINTNAPGASLIEKKVLQIGAEDFDQLTTPLRFNVAHELAHVIFYDLLGGDWTHSVLKDHKDALENACNQIARALLLPKAAFERDLKSDLYSASRLFSLARRYRVSPRMAVFRLHLDDLQHYLSQSHCGLIALVERRSGEYYVTASHTIGTLARLRWRVEDWSKDGVCASDLHLGVDLNDWLNRGGDTIVDSEVRWVNSGTVPCRVDSFCFGRDSSLALVTVRLTGYLQDRPSSM